MTLVDRQRIARDTMAFWFDTNGASFEFQAGQHADFIPTRPFPGADGGSSVTLSIANPPQRKSPVMLAMRTCQSSFRNVLELAALGDTFIASRARGSFTLHHDVIRPAVFLAGGMGIAPIRSILHWATRERLPHRLYLFYSNRQVADAAFIREFETMTAQNPNFTFIPTVTRHANANWLYEKGRINRQMLKRYLVWPKGPIYYLAGPSGMVAAISELLISLGVSDDDLNTEHFGEDARHQDSVHSRPETVGSNSHSAS
jgi:Flavodoxin reductases (ferredoxin-NADPH reductases) family 1